MRLTCNGPLGPTSSGRLAEMPASSRAWAATEANRKRPSRTAGECEPDGVAIGETAVTVAQARKRCDAGSCRTTTEGGAASAKQKAVKRLRYSALSTPVRPPAHEWEVLPVQEGGGDARAARRSTVNGASQAGLRARGVGNAPRRTAFPRMQWRHGPPRSTYRCGGSAGIVPAGTHRLPVSPHRARTAAGHLKRRAECSGGPAGPSSGGRVPSAMIPWRIGIKKMCLSGGLAERGQRVCARVRRHSGPRRRCAGCGRTSVRFRETSTSRKRAGALGGNAGRMDWRTDAVIPRQGRMPVAAAAAASYRPEHAPATSCRHSSERT